MSPDRQRVADPRTAASPPAPRAIANDRRDARDDVARSDSTRKPRDDDGTGAKGQRGFARRIDCAPSSAAPKKAVARGGRVSPAKRPPHDPDGRVH